MERAVPESAAEYTRLNFFISVVERYPYNLRPMSLTPIAQFEPLLPRVRTAVSAVISEKYGLYQVGKTALFPWK